MQDLFKLLKTKDIMLASAESCTGGLIAKTITDEPGSSAYFERGFITYSNQAKKELLAISHEMLLKHGAVSKQVAIAMAQGALEHSHAGIAVSCTGIAGPSGGSDEKPVGLVYIGVASKMDEPASYEHHFDGDREQIREQTLNAAIQHLKDHLQ